RRRITWCTTHSSAVVAGGDEVIPGRVGSPASSRGRGLWRVALTGPAARPYRRVQVNRVHVIRQREVCVVDNETRPVQREGGEQGELFPDSSVPDDLVGYRGPAACQIAGITYRQLDYWARTKLVEPSIRTAHGSGSQRLYSFKDLLVLKIVKRLLDA